MRQFTLMYDNSSSCRAGSGLEESLGESRLIQSGYLCKVPLRKDEEREAQSLGADCGKNQMRKKTEPEMPLNSGLHS